MHTMSHDESLSLPDQTTINHPVTVHGRGYLTGVNVELTFQPSAANTGIVFVRSDLPDQPKIPANINSLIPRQRRTTIARGNAVVEMVEHVMAALAGLGIDNCRVEINAAETPGLDGSSKGFVDALSQSGITTLNAKAKVYIVQKAITVSFGGMMISIIPSPLNHFQLTYTLDYSAAPVIGTQIHDFQMMPGQFSIELASARTFVLDSEIQALQSAGIGLHCTPQDLVIFGSDGPIGNHLHFTNEPVRHKMLDVIGDLNLLGSRIWGHVVAYKSGHQLNAELVRAIAADANFPQHKQESE
jgi:UDP-3-O-[3-hydroxymyristoyl] N-acetylglucosamine deacetylase / 3-hydroxyacyl-[acyl-carrier-protein] dehydratase